MIARTRKAHDALLLCLLLICIVPTPHLIASPSAAGAAEQHEPAHYADSTGPTPFEAIWDADVRLLQDRAEPEAVEAAEGLRISAKVGSEHAIAAASGSSLPDAATQGEKTTIDAVPAVNAPETQHAASLVDKTLGLPPQTASTLIGHVTNISHRDGSEGESEPKAAAQPPLAGDNRQEQPPQAPKKPEQEEDRHNFALAKDGAKIVAANKEARKPDSVLDSDGDTFVKNECKADKWLIIELSQVTKVDMIRLSQDELYSSRIKNFEVFGRQSHPRAEGPDYGSHLNASAWQPLGSFTAANMKGTQAFYVEPPGWAKYVQLRLLSHYGSEPVCALNDVRVYGKSAAEDLEDRLAMEAAADDDEAAAAEQQSSTEGLEQTQQQEGALPQLAIDEPQSRGQPVEDEEKAKAAEQSSGDERERLGESSPDLKLEQQVEGRQVLAPAEGTATTAESRQTPEAAPGSAGTAEALESGESHVASKGAIPPVLDMLGEGLMRLIVPPGAGKKRSSYSGKPADPLALPQPDTPSPKPEDGRSQQATQTPPGLDASSQEEGINRSAEVVVSPPGEPVKDVSSGGDAQPAAEPMTAHEPGSRIPEEAGSSNGNGGKKPAKEDRGLEKDGDLQLAGSSAGSSKSRHGGSVYDLLVAEIKALKLQQKAASRLLADMQKNVTLAISAIAAEVSALHRRVSEIEDGAAVLPATCPAALPEGAGADGRVRVYPNSSADREAPAPITLSHSEGGPAPPMTINIDAMTLALELASLRSANERASRREFALVMVIVMLCAIFVLSLPQLASQSARLKSIILLLAVANGFFGILLHFANSMQPDKGMFTHMHRLLGA